MSLSGSTEEASKRLSPSPQDKQLQPAPRVFSSAQVGVASLIGGPLGGAVLLKRNFRVIGAQPESAMPLVWASAITLVWFVISFKASRSTGIVLPVAIALGSWRYANRLQGRQIAERLSGGWQLHSWWRTIAIAIIVLIGTLVVSALLALFLVELLSYGA